MSRHPLSVTIEQMLISYEDIMCQQFLVRFEFVCNVLIEIMRRDTKAVFIWQTETGK